MYSQNPSSYRISPFPNHGQENTVCFLAGCYHWDYMHPYLLLLMLSLLLSVFNVAARTEVCVAARPVEGADEVSVHGIAVVHNFLSIQKRLAVAAAAAAAAAVAVDMLLLLLMLLLL